MSGSITPPAAVQHATESVDTLVIGGGQAGLATSYWLTRAGIEHQVVDRRVRLGGSWPDRWDSLCLIAPNWSLQLPGMPYDGPDPDGFMGKDDVVAYVERYARTIGAPIRLGTKVRRLGAVGDRFLADTGDHTIEARRVVLATGPYQQPKIPPAAQQISAHIQQLHSGEYRNPRQLANGGVLVVGTGMSGTQIAEELHAAGRSVHLAVGMCPALPRRYRGRDTIYWLAQTQLHGADVGTPFPTVAQLPSPAARFVCDPHVSGSDGGHDISLRNFARHGMHLYGRLESASGTTVRFSDDLEERLAYADSGFDEEIRPLFDAYIAAADIEAPPDDRPAYDTYLPDTGTELELDAAGIAAVLWATGYQLDFSWIDLPIFDEWGYPRHERGITEHPGLYAVGLRWLHIEGSSVFAGVGADAAHIVEHIAGQKGGG